MNSATPVTLPDAAILRKLGFGGRGALSELLGSYRSAFRGSGLTFSSLREYTPGDDTKRIHWKASARSGRVYVKSYDEERALRVMVAVDQSRSMHAVPLGNYGSSAARAHTFATLVGTLALSTGDALGATTFSDVVHTLREPKLGRLGLQRLLTALNTSVPFAGIAALAPILKALQPRLKRRTLLFLISDFFSPLLEEDLRPLSTHDIVLVQVDPYGGKPIPKLGLCFAEDAKSGRRITINLSGRALRGVEAHRREHQAELQKLATKARADFVVLGDSPFDALKNLLLRRGGR
jgi:uncharacterized protein (DUF58 family)